MFRFEPNGADFSNRVCMMSLYLGGAGLGDAGPAVSGWADGIWRLIANLSLIGQVWSLDAAPPLNAPFWSLNFEV